MNITTEHANGIAVVRVGESRLMYPLLSEFSAAVQKLIALVNNSTLSRRLNGCECANSRSDGPSIISIANQGCGPMPVSNVPAAYTCAMPG